MLPAAFRLALSGPGVLEGRPSLNLCHAPSLHYPSVQAAADPSSAPQPLPLFHVYPSVETSEGTWPPRAQTIVS